MLSMFFFCQYVALLSRLQIKKEMCVAPSCVRRHISFCFNGLMRF